jgi:deoxyribodipyrimidine photo-lyase
MIQTERIKKLNQKKICQGDYVLYWMQASQRVEWNHSLEYTIREANQLNLPVLVYFRLIDNFPEANERHYCFMLQGLREVREKLENMNILLIVSYAHGNYPDLLSTAQNAALVITDCGYLQFQRQWRREYAGKISCSMVQVESDVVVPVTTASSKEEYSAATIRRKITSKFNDYLVPLNSSTPNLSSLDSRFSSFPLGDIPGALSKLKIDGSVKPSSFYRGGSEAAEKHLQDFLKHKIHYFHQLRNDASKEYVSNLSPYLHFGQISPLYVALKAMQQDTGGIDVFLEELIIRRELAINFVYYNPRYMSYDCLPDWVKKMLQKHRNDAREYRYSPGEFEQAKTHDPYWNAAQTEMKVTGKMHGYMRMYWGKKILEWSKSPEEAYRTALYLNNKYELDGRDPNGFAGVAWCFGKHDRPWAERPIFGNVRYMNANGLKRKFDIEAYVTKVQETETNKTNKSFCRGSRGTVFSKRVPLAAGGKKK